MEKDQKKYEELVRMVLEMEFAEEDPLLQSVNMSLQESYIDQFEKAMKHLEDQKKRVETIIEAQQNEIKNVNEKSELLQEKIKERDFIIESQKKDLSKLNEQITDKEGIIEVNKAELQALTQQCQIMSKQQKDTEELNKKLQEKYDQVNKDMKKLMRTQDQLNKDNKRVITKPHSTTGNDIERIMMNYEDQISRIEGMTEKRVMQSVELEVQKTKEQYKKEVLETLDRLILSSTKMPTFNDLALQLAQRVDKVRCQERIKLNEEQPKSMKSSQSQENALIETFKPEAESNEDEMVQSLAKWLKQSGMNNKSFFQNDENKSLLFSELVVQQQHEQMKSGNKNEQIDILHKKINELEKIIEQQEKDAVNTADSLKQVQEQNQQLKEEQKAKEASIKKSEEKFIQRNKEIEEEQKQRNQQMWKDVEKLKEQIKQELVVKSHQLDEEYDELENQKAKQREQLAKQQSELEAKYQKKLEMQEKEFRTNLQKMETDIKSTNEKSKDEQLNSIYKSLEDQYQAKIKQVEEDHQQQLLQLKQEMQQKLEDAKRVKDREVKKLKEEAERIKKSFDDKQKKMEMDSQTEKDSIEREFKEKIEQASQKHKKDQKAACDKVRAEMRNQVDNVKNEMAKLKIDFERDKKKMINEHQTEIDALQREWEEKMENELRLSREKLEKVWKKKIEERENEWSKKVEEREKETEETREVHKEELKKEKERIEARLKEQVRAEVKLEVHTELEDEYQQQLEKLRQQHSIEIDKIKSKFEVMIREEKASQLPMTTLKVNDSRNAEVQCSEFNEEPIEESMTHSVCCSSQMSSNLYIEQLKQLFEDELTRQQQVFEVQLQSKQQMTVRIFEEILTLEFDKILESIYHKSTSSSQQKVKNLDARRKHINNLIADILNRNDDRKEQQMKLSLENLKKKISEVLKIFKSELEKKFNKKQEQIVQEITLQEKLKIQNLSEIVSNQQEIVSEGGNTKNDDYMVAASCENFRNISQTPTPRNLNMQMKAESKIKSMQNSADKNEHQLSDIKKYISEEENSNQILKKITPVQNSKGVYVVEVDKVVRDLKMLFNTIKQSKFYRQLMSIEELTNKQQNEIKQENEDSLQIYRQILNDFFKMIVKLNSGVDQMGKQSEVYKLKLLNSELREKIKKMEQQLEISQSQVQVEDALNYFGSKPLCKEAQQCLQLLESSQFIINKQQFKLFQLLDLFASPDNGSCLNTNLQEVNNSCKLYIEHNPVDAQKLTQEQLLMSHCSPDKIKITPEMLSPEETAQLIANVFQKLNQTKEVVNSNQLDSNQSFFQTFLSNDEYVKSAENFIQKYREQMNFTQKYKNLPLQVNQEIYNRTNYAAINNMQRKRSRSQSNNIQASTQLPTNHFQSYVSNVFQSNMLMERQNSLASCQPILIDTQSQNSQVNTSFPSMNARSTCIAKQPYQTIYNKHGNMSIDNVSSAQNSVNALFEKIKSNFQNNASREQSFQ